MLAFSVREPAAAGLVVDILLRPPISFEQLVGRAVEGALFGRKLPIASIDDLIVMKRVAGRPRDLLAIAALEKIAAGLDPNG